MTLAPWSAAHSIPVDMSEHQALPSALLETRTGRTLTFQATPATPTPLLPTASMIPVTSVPCDATGLVLAVPSAELNPGRSMLAARSGCDASTPVSQTATTTELAPCVISQAAAEWM